MTRFHRFIAFIAFGAIAAAAACHNGSTAATPATPAEHSLSGLAGQHIVLLPAYSVRVVPPLPWNSAVGPPAEARRTLDADILAALEERGLRKTWICPEDLEQSYKLNTSYAADPYTLAEEPLRSPALVYDMRLPEPLATQLRTLVALHEDARLVLAPVELRYEAVGTGGRGVLKLVLVDPRYSAVRWIGEISSDTVSAYGPVISASIAAKLAGVVATP